MKNLYTKKNLKILVTLILCLMPIAISLRTYICLNLVEADTGFYTTGSLLPKIFDVTVLLICVIIAVFPFFFRIFSRKGDFEPELLNEENQKTQKQEILENADEAPSQVETFADDIKEDVSESCNDGQETLLDKTKLVFSEKNFFCTFSTALLGFILIACAFLAFLYRDKASQYLTLELIQYVLLAFSGFYFVLVSMGMLKPYSTVLSLCSLTVPVTFCLFLVIRYLYISPNAYEKLYYFDVVTAVALVLFFLNEAKLLTGDANLHKIGSYTAYSLVSLLLICCSAVPTVILTVLSEIKLESFIFICVSEIIICVYIISKLLNIVKSVK